MVALVLFALGVFFLPFVFPTPPPIITRFSGTQLFSPNADGARDTAMFSVRVRTPGTLDLTVADDAGNVVKTLADDSPTRRGWVRIPWRGRGDDGQPLPDGVYSVRLRAGAPGDKQFSSSRRVRIDTDPPGITRFEVGSALTRPAGDEPVACRAVAVIDDEGTVEMDVASAGRPGHEPLRRFGPRPGRPGAEVRWHWAGTAPADTPVPPGLYTVALIARDTARNAARETRTCWVGHLVGRATHAGSGDLTRVTLFDVAGRELPGSTPVTLRFHRRVGEPGPDPMVLGPRVARPVTARADRARIRVPATVSPDDLWLVADAADGRALIRVTAR